MGVHREKAFIPLTYSQEALSVVPDLKVVRGVEAISVFRLNGGGIIGSVNVGDKDMTNEISHLGRSEFKSSFRPEAYF